MVDGGDKNKGKNTSEDPPVKAAHFEDPKVESLLDLYLPHAELAHRAHQLSASTWSSKDKNPVVELVESSALGESNQSIPDYDVVSFSQGFTKFGVITSHLKALEGGDTIILGSAGNNGLGGSPYSHVKSTPFESLRNYAAVGEVTFNEKGEPIIDDHNNLGAVAFLVNNPYDEMREATNITHLPTTDELYQYSHLVEQYVEYNEGLNPTEKAFLDRVDDIIGNPQKLHDVAVPRLREMGIKQNAVNGKEYGLEGTSFPAPTAAGYFTGALQEQAKLKASNQPHLTPDEVFMTGYLSTRPVLEKEGKSKKIEYQPNGRGVLTASEAGFGYLDPELMKQNIDKAVKAKAAGKTQGLGTYQASGMFSESEEYDTYEFDIQASEAQQSNVFKMVLHLNTGKNNGFNETRYNEEQRRLDNAQAGVSTIYPIKVISPEGTVVEKHIRVNSFGRLSSISMDEFFGEDLSGKWTIISQDEGRMPFMDVQMEAHTYEKGGFIDQLVNEKVKADKAYLAKDQGVQMQVSSEVREAYDAYYQNTNPETKAHYDAGLNLIKEMNEFESDVRDVALVEEGKRAIELSEMDQALDELRSAFDKAIEEGFSVTNQDFKEFNQTAKETTQRFR